MADWNYKPNDVRGFVHGRIKRAVGGFITGGPTGAVAGFIQGGGQDLSTRGKKRGGRVVDFRHVHQSTGRRHTHFVGDAPISSIVALPEISGPCQFPLVRDVDGVCRTPGSPADVSVGGGMALMGRFGAGLAPQHENVATMRCLPGMVLGKMEADGSHLCYNKKDLTNKERLWPRGRRPLGTPGEMAALSKAASFGRRMETTVKRMQKIGVLKKPAKRSSTQRVRALDRSRGLPPPTSIINVE